MFKHVSSRSPLDILVIAYAFDPKSMVFSHQYQIICKLSEEFRNVYLIANEVDYTCAKPQNIEIFDLKWGRSNSFKKFFRLYRAFFSVFLKNPKFVLFSFMTETHSMALGPFTSLFGIRHILWYAHTSCSARVRIATRFANKILTSTSDSFPLEVENSKSKLFPIGQMVDETKFIFNQDRNYKDRDKWIHVGRVDPSKEIETIIELFKYYLNISPTANLNIVGKSTQGNEYYEESLKAKYSDDISKGKITFSGKQSQAQVRNLLYESDLFIHSFRGSLDKALVEATMTGITVITKNNSYIREFGRLSDRKHLDEKGVDFLQSEIDCWHQLEAEQLKLVALRRSEIAYSGHSLGQWIQKLVAELKG